MTEQQQQEVAAAHPPGRLGKPEDVALATLFLVSESAAWITGVTLEVAGGWIMRWPRTAPAPPQMIALPKWSHRK